jgi:hypothetical protein
MKTTITRYIGKCPICEGDFKLTLDRNMVHHGYERLGHGSIVGDCRAVGAPSYEWSCDISKVYRSEVEARLTHAEQWLARLQSGEITELLHTEYPGAKLENIVKGDPKWPRILRTCIAQTESKVEALTCEIARMTRLIEAWVRRPLRTVEEFESGGTAERNAKRAAREAEKAAKVAAKIASYQKRLDTAVRKKTTSTIADIFESAPRQLRDLTGCSREQAFVMLDRTHVFAAFGLDLAADDRHSGPNGSMLSSMRYSKKDIEWPASLK